MKSSEADTKIAIDPRGAIRLTFDLRVYSLDVLYSAAYIFLARCWVRLDRASAREITVTLKAKEKLDRKGLVGLAGEFENELVDQHVRARLAKEHTKLREMIVGRALFGAQGLGVQPSAPDAPAPVDEDYLADPLGIAVPWEDKFLASRKQEASSSGEKATPGEPPAPATAPAPDVPLSALRRGPGPDKWTDRQEFVPFDETAEPPAWTKK
ncbi:MAG: His-Xaa-Ser system protein HxsD [Myxococcota bacterium]